MKCDCFKKEWSAKGAEKVGLVAHQLSAKHGFFYRNWKEGLKDYLRGKPKKKHEEHLPNSGG